MRYLRFIPITIILLFILLIFTYAQIQNPSQITAQMFDTFCIYHIPIIIPSNTPITTPSTLQLSLKPSTIHLSRLLFHSNVPTTSLTIQDVMKYIKTPSIGLLSDELTPWNINYTKPYITIQQDINNNNNNDTFIINLKNISQSLSTTITIPPSTSTPLSSTTTSDQQQQQQQDVQLLNTSLTFDLQLIISTIPYQSSFPLYLTHQIGTTEQSLSSSLPLLPPQPYSFEVATGFVAINALSWLSTTGPKEVPFPNDITTITQSIQSIQSKSDYYTKLFNNQINNNNSTNNDMKPIEQEPLYLLTQYQVTNTLLEISNSLYYTIQFGESILSSTLQSTDLLCHYTVYKPNDKKSTSTSIDDDNDNTTNSTTIPTIAELNSSHSTKMYNFEQVILSKGHIHLITQFIQAPLNSTILFECTIPHIQFLTPSPSSQIQVIHQVNTLSYGPITSLSSHIDLPSIFITDVLLVAQYNLTIYTPYSSLPNIKELLSTQLINIPSSNDDTYKHLTKDDIIRYELHNTHIQSLIQQQLKLQLLDSNYVLNSITTFIQFVNLLIPQSIGQLNITDYYFSTLPIQYQFIQSLPYSNGNNNNNDDDNETITTTTTTTTTTPNEYNYITFSIPIAYNYTKQSIIDGVSSLLTVFNQQQGRTTQYDLQPILYPLPIFSASPYKYTSISSQQDSNDYYRYNQFKYSSLCNGSILISSSSSSSSSSTTTHNNDTQSNSTEQQQHQQFCTKLITNAPCQLHQDCSYEFHCDEYLHTCQYGQYHLNLQLPYDEERYDVTNNAMSLFSFSSWTKSAFPSLLSSQSQSSSSQLQSTNKLSTSTTNVKSLFNISTLLKTVHPMAAIPILILFAASPSMSDFIDVIIYLWSCLMVLIETLYELILTIIDNLPREVIQCFVYETTPVCPLPYLCTTVVDNTINNSNNHHLVELHHIPTIDITLSSTITTAAATTSTISIDINYYQQQQPQQEQQRELLQLLPKQPLPPRPQLKPLPIKSYPFYSLYSYYTPKELVDLSRIFIITTFLMFLILRSLPHFEQLSSSAA